MASVLQESARNFIASASDFVAINIDGANLVLDELEGQLEEHKKSQEEMIKDQKILLQEQERLFKELELKIKEFEEAEALQSQISDIEIIEDSTKGDKILSEQFPFIPKEKHVTQTNLMESLIIKDRNCNPPENTEYKTKMKTLIDKETQTSNASESIETLKNRNDDISLRQNQSAQQFTNSQMILITMDSVTPIPTIASHHQPEKKQTQSKLIENPVLDLEFRTDTKHLSKKVPINHCTSDSKKGIKSNSRMQNHRVKEIPILYDDSPDHILDHLQGDVSYLDLRVKGDLFVPAYRIKSKNDPYSPPLLLISRCSYRLLKQSSDKELIKT